MEACSPTSGINRCDAAPCQGSLAKQVADTTKVMCQPPHTGGPDRVSNPQACARDMFLRRSTKTYSLNFGKFTVSALFLQIVGGVSFFMTVFGTKYPGLLHAASTTATFQLVVRKMLGSFVFHAHTRNNTPAYNMPAQVATERRKVPSGLLLAQ